MSGWALTDKRLQTTTHKWVEIVIPISPRPQRPWRKLTKKKENRAKRVVKKKNLASPK